MDSRDQERIELATKLFEAWSSGDADAPEQYFEPDGMLEDVVAGDEPHKGWPAIRAFFAPATTVMASRKTGCGSVIFPVFRRVAETMPKSE